mgnify:CR=1 FL=1
MKIVLIGPFPPYRGGISMFNHSLSKELNKEHTVYRISFSTLYPKILFPGKSQFCDFKGDGSTEIISSINPLTWNKTVHYVHHIKPDLIIFQYWHPFFAPAFTSIARKIKRLINSRIIINCNNVFPHEKMYLGNLLSKKFFKYADHFVVMANSVKKDLLSIVPDASCIESKHPIYDAFGKSKNREDAKNLLRVKSKRVILFFGLIRGYKGLDLLIEATQILKNKLNNFKIIVAGECYDNKKKYLDLTKKLNVEDLFIFNFDFIKNEDVSKYFCAADVIVLPYRSGTQSGIAPIAYHFNRPVISTDVGGLSESVHHKKSGLLCKPDSFSISNSIIDFYNSNYDYGSYIEEYKKTFSWKAFADKIISAI